MLTPLTFVVSKYTTCRSSDGSLSLARTLTYQRDTSFINFTASSELREANLSRSLAKAKELKASAVTIGAEDDTCYTLTMDMVPGRINLWVNNGRVVKAVVEKVPSGS